jgi:formylmethanofuran dehydrogenase subunit E
MTPTVMMTTGALLLVGLLGLDGCASGASAGPATLTDAHARPSHLRTGAADPEEKALDDVATIHGAAGPWAVAGYRMGEHALARLGLDRGSFDLEVVHHTPRAVKFSCIADGAQAATGASAGKLNLVLADADEAHVATTFRRKSTGQSITLRPAASFADRFGDVPRGQARIMGKQVLELPASDVFEEIPSAR